MTESNPTEADWEAEADGIVQEWWPKICFHKFGLYEVFEISIHTLAPRREWYDTCRCHEATLNSRQRLPEQWVLAGLEEDQQVAAQENFGPGPIWLDW